MTLKIIHLRRGDDLEVDVTCTSGGLPLDMTGYTVEADIMFSNCAPVDLAMSWVNQAIGTLKVTLPNTETEDLHVGDYLLQVRAINAAGKKTSTKPVTVRVRD